MDYYCHKKEGNSDTCYYVDELWKHAKCHEAGAKRQVLYDPIYMRWNRHIHRDRRWNRGYLGLGGAKMESYYLKDTEFQFEKMKKFLSSLAQQYTTVQCEFT